jgi:hypothetical protein
VAALTAVASQSAFAADVNCANAADSATLECIIQRINTNIINPGIMLLLAVAVVIFIWGVVSFFQNIDNAEERAQGIRHMIYGIIGIVIMVSVKGIIVIIKNFIGV